MPPANCDINTNITSFPLVFTGTPTAELYNSIDQPITIEFQWASRSVSPSFSTGTVKNIIDESSIYGSGLSNISTIRYNNTLYNLYSVQICSASHNSWLLPASNKDKNTEDLVITFYNPSLTRSYVIIVLPIIKNGTRARDPAYLTALGSGQTPGTFSLGSCMPDKKSLFIYYSTCLDGYTEHQSTQTVSVFVAVGGISVSPDLMTSIKGKITGGTVPSITLPFTSYFATETSIIETTDIGKYVLSTNDLLNYEWIKNKYKDLTVQERDDPSSAYKCVALNPEKDVVDGKIKVDIESGKLLSKVLAERDAVMAASGIVPQNPSTALKFNKNMNLALGIFFAILILLGLIYLISSWWTNSSPTMGVVGGIVYPPDWVAKIPMYGVMVIGAGLIGFIVGATVI
jgi:hypothetical protein